LSIIILIVGIWRYTKLNRQLKHYYTNSNDLGIILKNEQN